MDTSGGSFASGIEASVGGRYATALFELARDEASLDAVAASMATLKQALAESADLRGLIASPLVSRDESMRAIGAVARSLGLDTTTAHFLGVLARGGRLGQLVPAMRAFAQLNALYRGETTAEVISAHALDDEQVAALKAKLRQKLGRDVAIERSVDPAILGGLIVKLGSQRIDGSIRTKLNMLAQAMKG